MTLFSDKMLISHRCIRGLMPNLIKKSWMVSNEEGITRKTHGCKVSERCYLVRTLASRPGVPGSNPIAAPKPCEVYPSTSGLLTFKKSETVLWSIAKHYHYYYYPV